MTPHFRQTRPTTAPKDDELTDQGPALAPHLGRAVDPWVLLRTCIIIPAFNEGGSVADVVRSVHAAMPGAAVVVVNDGSTDDTALQAKQAGAVVITLPVNLGIGGAVQTGYRFALHNGFDVAMQIDGDGQHDPSEAVRLFGPLVAGRADMVIGSRWLGRGDYVAPPSRRFGMRILASLVCWRAGGVFTDTTSGFRAVGQQGIQLFADDYPTDFPEVETLVMASRDGLRIEEAPVRMTHRQHGRSSIAGLNSAYYMLRVILALLVGSPGRRSSS